MLIGIAVAAVLDAVVSYLLTRAEILDAQRAAVWLTGSLNGRSWEHVRPIALAMVEGPAAALAMVAALDTDARLAGHYRLDAVRAHFHEMAGDLAAAREHYLAAAGKTASIPERNYLTMKAAKAAEPRT